MIRSLGAALLGGLILFSGSGLQAEQKKYLDKEGNIEIYHLGVNPCRQKDGTTTCTDEAMLQHLAAVDPVHFPPAVLPVLRNALASEPPALVYIPKGRKYISMQEAHNGFLDKLITVWPDQKPAKEWVIDMPPTRYIFDKFEQCWNLSARLETIAVAVPPREGEGGTVSCPDGKCVACN